MDDCHLSKITKLEKYFFLKRGFPLGGEFHQNEKKIKKIGVVSCDPYLQRLFF
jgi:hypothetical protein